MKSTVNFVSYNLQLFFKSLPFVSEKRLVNTQDELDLMHDSSFLTLEFTESSVVIIELMDGVYRDNFFVPTTHPPDGKTLTLIFDTKATFKSFVNFDGQKLEIQKGKKLILVNSHGKWIESAGKKKSIFILISNTYIDIIGRQ